jgi:hypothetical protein
MVLQIASSSSRTSRFYACHTSCTAPTNAWKLASRETEPELTVVGKAPTFDTEHPLGRGLMSKSPRVRSGHTLHPNARLHACVIG